MKTPLRDGGVKLQSRKALNSGKISQQITACDAGNVLFRHAAGSECVQQVRDLIGPAQVFGCGFNAIKVGTKTDNVAAAHLTYIIDMLGNAFNTACAFFRKEGRIEVNADIASVTDHGPDLLIGQVAEMTAQRHTA